MKRLILILVFMFSFVGCKGEPDINTECTMNGLGKITCEYTNTGKGKGSVCGNIRVFKLSNHDEKIESKPFCSGPIEPKETKKLETQFVDLKEDTDVKEFCKSIYNDGRWGDECGFNYFESL